jgi:hypothetical protein
MNDNGTPGNSSDDQLVATTGVFGEFVFASDSNPLPVELTSFGGITAEDDVRLTWRTASETNNAGFTVQRQVDTESGWTAVGFVESQAPGGTTAEPQSYHYTDSGLPYADTLRYRLQQVDVNGEVEVIEPVTITRSTDDLELKPTFPNPACTQAMVRIGIPDRQNVRLTLYDVMGRQVRTLYNGVLGGRKEMQVNLSGLSSGTYFLQLQVGKQTRTQQVTVVR